MKFEIENFCVMLLSAVNEVLPVVFALDVQFGRNLNSMCQFHRNHSREDDTFLVAIIENTFMPVL